MKHYGLSMRDLDQMSADEFEQMFVWAAAAEAVKAEEMDKQNAQSKNAMKVGGTDVGRPMPFSDGW